MMVQPCKAPSLKTNKFYTTKHILRTGFSPTPYPRPSQDVATEQDRKDTNIATTAAVETKPTNRKVDESTDTIDQINMQNKPWLSKAQYKKHIKKLNKQQITAVFNYSSLILTEHMEELLNLGQNFAFSPLRLDITQILVDYKKYERSLVWHEFWYGREDAETKYEPPMFKTNKTNFPKNYTVPEGLKVMIGAVKSEIMDPMNRNKVSCNIGKDSISALCELINLQK